MKTYLEIIDGLGISAKAVRCHYHYIITFKSREDMNLFKVSVPDSKRQRVSCILEEERDQRYD